VRTALTQERTWGEEMDKKKRRATTPTVLIENAANLSSRWGKRKKRISYRLAGEKEGENREERGKDGRRGAYEKGGEVWVVGQSTGGRGHRIKQDPDVGNDGK